MTALSRLVTFGAVVSTGGFLLVAFAEPVPATTATAEDAAPKKEQPSDSEFLKKEPANPAAAESTKPAVTESTKPETTVSTSAEPTVKHKTRGDGKTVLRHDGKEMKEFLPPIAEGPGDAAESAPDLPSAVAPPEFPGTFDVTPVPPTP